MWKWVVGCGALLAAGTLALQWLDYQRLAWMHAGDIYLFLVAAASGALRHSGLEQWNTSAACLSVGSALSSQQSGSRWRVPGTRAASQL